mmetsp:Transcript_24931/g.48592  ORF Transcript_24931/g.48592 Transcript_24931/m.48592 type:complete len:260 (-) Transcript_24931:381-1160(-)
MEINVAEIGMPLVLSPKTLPIDMFQPKCQPSTNPNRPPVKMTFKLPAIPPTKMLRMLLILEPPGEPRCNVTKKNDSVSAASSNATTGVKPKCATKAPARLCSIHPRRGNSSFKATLRWNTTSQKIQTLKLSDSLKTSKNFKTWIQPAKTSVAKMKKTMNMPTHKPRPRSTKKRASSVNPIEARLLPSTTWQENQTTSKEPMFIPMRMHASLHRWRPVTWLRKKGCPCLEAKGSSSVPVRLPGGGQAIDGSCEAISSFVG